MQLATRFTKNAVQLRSEQPLAESQIRSIAPSIFAEAAHESRSTRYTYIPTINVLRGLQREGFEPFMVGQSRSRVAGKAEFTKHMLRMRYQGSVARGPGSEVPEIILVNSHDGSSSYQMLAGMFRFVCMNGMICGDLVEDFRVKHSGDVAGEVIDAAFRIVGQNDRILESVDSMKQVRLDTGEQKVFAHAAALLRFGAQDGETTVESAAPFAAERLLDARRPEDLGNSLWTTFQRVQENAIRGGQHGRSTQGRRMQTREVAGIDRNVSLNRALWSLAEGLQGLKAGRSIEDLIAA